MGVRNIAKMGDIILLLLKGREMPNSIHLEKWIFSFEI
jgi:hypothetical protein